MALTECWKKIEESYPCRKWTDIPFNIGLTHTYCTYNQMCGVKFKVWNNEVNEPDLFKGGTWVKCTDMGRVYDIWEKIDRYDGFMAVLTQRTEKAGVGTSVSAGTSKQHYILYPALFITWSEWVDKLFKEAPTNIEDMVLDVFTQVMGKVRDLHKTGKESFISVQESIGVTRENIVVFIQPPLGPQLDFHENIVELSGMASSLLTLLSGVVDSKTNTVYNLLDDFQKFIDDINQIYPRLANPLNPSPTLSNMFVQQCFGLNHPVCFTNVDKWKFYMKMARIGNKDINRSLCFTQAFIDNIQNIIPNWISTLYNDQENPWGDVLEYSDPNASTTVNQNATATANLNASNNSACVYAENQITLFIWNAIKHFEERAKGRLSKWQVMELLERLIPRLACALFRGYAEATIDGYVHRTYEVDSVLYNRSHGSYH